MLSGDGIYHITVIVHIVPARRPIVKPSSEKETATMTTMPLREWAKPSD